MLLQCPAESLPVVHSWFGGLRSNPNPKILPVTEPYGNGRWQLYDLASDPGETKDRAAEFPDLGVLSRYTSEKEMKL